MKKVYLIIAACFLIPAFSIAQVNMAVTGSHSQDFNTLITTGSGTWTDNSTIANWYSQRTGTGTTISADAGTNTAGNLYSYGTGTNAERALGTLGSGNVAAGSFAHGVLLRNTSGTIITSITVTYTLEQWRKSGVTVAQDLTFYYKTSSATITALNPNNNATWTQVTALTLSSPINTATASALDGNNALNRVTATNIAIPSLSLANNDYIMLKWEDPDHAGTDHGLSIDDVTINWTVSAGTPNINVSTSSLSGFLSTVSVPSAEQTYNVDGNNLTANIVITPPTGFEISTGTGGGFVPTNPINLAPTAGTVSSTPIYVRMNSATLGVNTGNITHTSTGATQKDVALAGKVLAAEPTVQSSITIGVVTNSTVVVNFAGGNGARRILLAKLAVPVDSDPVDGTTYTANANFGSGSQIGAGNYVVYDGTGNTQLVTGLTAGATYHFAIYEYNDGGVSGAENYLVPGGTGNATLLTYANVYIWTGLTGGSWTDPLNWLPPRLFPATNDSLFFIDGTTETVVNVPNETIGYLNVSLGTNVTLQAAVTSTTLTIGNSTAVDLFVDAGAALNISGANAYTIHIPTGAVALINGNMTFTGGAHKITAADASGITFNSGAVFTAGTGFTSNAFGVNPTAVANSVIFINGSTYRQISGGNPFALNQPASAVVFQTGSLYKLESNLTPSVSGRTYANFELDAPSSVLSPAGASLLSMDNLTVTNGNISFSMTGGFDLKGNITVATGATLGFVPGSAATLRFNGTVPQSINSTGTLTFGASQNVEIANGLGLTLNTPVTLLASLNFNVGRIHTNAGNLLILGSASSVSGYSNVSFVTGPVKKIGNTDFTFPVGKANGLVPLRISNFQGSSPTDEFTAEYIRASAYTLGPEAAPFITRVSACEYWTLDRNVGTPTVDLTLYWTTNNNCNGPYVTNLAQLEIAHFDGTVWDNSSTGFSATTGTTVAGDITWSGVTAFGPFTLASKSGDNPLPIVINYFTGTKQNGDHLLNWQVSCIGTPSANIELERSTDGRNYFSIYSIFATAVRCQQPFNYTDNQPAAGVNYYRLKMTDADGKINYSSIVSLINAVKGFEIMNIAPNPIVNRAFNLRISAAEKMQMEVMITDMQGRVVEKRSLNLVAGFNSIPMNVSKLAAGTYQLYGNTAGERTRVLRFVVQ